MIVIWQNGEVSDLRQIHFIDIDVADLPAFEHAHQFVRQFQHHKAEILGTAPTVNWRTSAQVSFSQWLEDVTFGIDMMQDDEMRAAMKQLPTDAREWLLNASILIRDIWVQKA